MDLEEFVKGTLVAIVRGVSGAQQELTGEDENQPSREGARVGVVNPRQSGGVSGADKRGLMVSTSGELIHIVKFDVAVTAEDGAGLSSGIRVLGMQISGELRDRASSLSRVQFEVPLELPRPARVTKQAAPAVKPPAPEPPKRPSPWTKVGP